MEKTSNVKKYLMAGAVATTLFGAQGFAATKLAHADTTSTADTSSDSLGDYQTVTVTSSGLVNVSSAASSTSASSSDVSDASSAASSSDATSSNASDSSGSSATSSDVSSADSSASSSSNTPSDAPRAKHNHQRFDRGYNQPQPRVTSGISFGRDFGRNQRPGGFNRPSQNSFGRAPQGFSHQNHFRF